MRVNALEHVVIKINSYDPYVIVDNLIINIILYPQGNTHPAKYL